MDFRAKLDNGMTDAVNPMKCRVLPSRDGFRTSWRFRRSQTVLQAYIRRCGGLGGVRHRNFVVLQAYIRQPNAHQSEYDFISNGSLDGTLKKIKDKQLHLSWPILHKIAVVSTIFISGSIPMLYTAGKR